MLALIPSESLWKTRTAKFKNWTWISAFVLSHRSFLSLHRLYAASWEAFSLNPANAHTTLLRKEMLLLAGSRCLKGCLDLCMCISQLVKPSILSAFLAYHVDACRHAWHAAFDRIKVLRPKTRKPGQCLRYRSASCETCGALESELADCPKSAVKWCSVHRCWLGQSFHRQQELR